MNVVDLRLPPVPVDLKHVLPFLQRAQEVRARDAVVCFWSLYYVAYLGMHRPKTKENKPFLVAVVDQLEEMKRQPKARRQITDEAAGRQYLRRFGFNIFEAANNEDSQNHATRSTAKKFLVASYFLEMLRMFGPLDVEVEETVKYAKFRAGDIVRSLRNGITPTPGISVVPALPQANGHTSISSNLSPQPNYPPVPAAWWQPPWPLPRVPVTTPSHKGVLLETSSTPALVTQQSPLFPPPTTTPAPVETWIHPTAVSPMMSSTLSVDSVDTSSSSQPRVTMKSILSPIATTPRAPSPTRSEYTESYTTGSEPGGSSRRPLFTPPVDDEDQKYPTYPMPYHHHPAIRTWVNSLVNHAHGSSSQPTNENAIDGELDDSGPLNNKFETTQDPTEDARQLAERGAPPVCYESIGGSQSTPQAGPKDSSSSKPPVSTQKRGGSAPSDLDRPAIGRTMSASAIISQLVEHGCQDITSSLNLSTCTKYPISTGGFGDIYRGKLRDGSLVAIKCMRVFFGSPARGQKHLKHAAREIHTWSKCEHRYVLKLLGLVKFRDQIGIVSPWVAQGSLNSLLLENPDMNRPQLCMQVADGLAYLHRCSVVHGDLKGANVLLSDNGDPLLTDFGNAVLPERTLQFTHTTNNTSLSYRWAAPELIRGEASYSFEADVFALGMTILEIITGTVPYSRMNDLAVSFAIAGGRLPERPEDTIPTKSQQGNALWLILTKCWDGVAKLRPSALTVRDLVAIIQPEGLLTSAV